MTTVVLGWDGLDHELLADYNLQSSFGERVRPIDTLVNDELDKPHTWELWPSIITGERPASHGIHADEYIESNWQNPLLGLAARLSTPIPDAIRWRVGRWLRGRGAEMGFETAAYYRERGISTVFDDVDSFALAVPNYRSEADARFGIDHDRGAALAEYMETETDNDGQTRRTPAADPDTFAGQIEADAAEKIALTRSAIARNNDLVFVWLAFLDTAGHVAPTVQDSDEWMRDAYEVAAEYTRFINNQLDDDDSLICVSDHGLQDGAHTETACIGSSPAAAIDDVDHVLDVAPMLQAQTIAESATDPGHERSGEDDEVHQRLQNLGYVD